MKKMNHLVIAVAALALSGTALVAQSKVGLSALPANLQEVVKSAQEKAAAETNPITQFVDSQAKQSQALETQLNDLLKNKGYLVHNPNADQVINIIRGYFKEIKEDLADISNTEPYADTITSDLASIPTLLSYLNTIGPQGSFPDKCVDYQGQKVTGIVEPRPGQRNMSFHYVTQEGDGYYDFIDPIDDVGLTGSGKEYVPSRTPNGMLQDGLLTDNKKVACLDHPYKPSQPIPKLTK